jgi:hypothetical protein
VKCWWCGTESTLLCDAPVGWERRVSDNTIIMDENYTCDAELCRACAKQIGNACGDGCHDTFDVCPVHAATGLSFKVKTLPNSAAAVDKVRREIRAVAWRAQMGVVKP